MTAFNPRELFVTMGTEPGHQLARSCDGCTLCCTLLPVTESAIGFDKPARKACQHECDKGCAIYEARPKACARFACGWVTGIGHPALHPKDVGFLFELGYSEGEGATTFISIRTDEAALQCVMVALAMGQALTPQSAWLSCGGDHLCVGGKPGVYETVAWHDGQRILEWLRARVAVDTSSIIVDRVMSRHVGDEPVAPEVVKRSIAQLRSVGSAFKKQASGALDAFKKDNKL